MTGSSKAEFVLPSDVLNYSYLIDNWSASVNYHSPQASLVCELACLIINLAGQLTGGTQDQSLWIGFSVLA